MRKARIRAALFVLLFLLFLLLMDYPYLSRIYNDMIAGDVIAEYHRGEEYSDCEPRLQWAQSYNRYLAGEGAYPEGEFSQMEVTDSKEDSDLEGSEGGDSDLEAFERGDSDFKPGGADPDDSTLEESTFLQDDESVFAWKKAARVLCLDGSDEAGWIRINALDLMLPLSVGTEDKALRTGAGILENCSLPVGGGSTHSCISAHRGLPDRTLFTNLDLLETGDTILVHTLNQTIAYKVEWTETVLPHETEHLSIRPGEDLLTLITCTPYGINTHRLYVHARRCEDVPFGEGEEDRTLRGFLDPLFWKLWWWIPASLGLIVFMILIVRRYLGRMRRFYF